MVVTRIVSETSFSEGDVSNIICDALKSPKIVFTPKQKMRDAANSVELSIDRDSVKASTGGSTTTNPDEDVTEDPLA